MTLRIAQFDTTCHVPPRHRSGAEVVDRLARGRFARDLRQHLGPSLARQPAIVRIRRLPLRVIIPASELNEDALSLAWRQAFGKALFTALAYPTGVGPFEVFRAESVASFIASAIQDLLDGTASTQWQYAEFEGVFRLGSTQAALALICEWQHQSMAILLELAQRRVLDRLLARFDELDMERLFVVLARTTDQETEPLSFADLIVTAKLALAHLPEKTIALRSRSYALSLFVEAHRVSQPGRSPRALFHALLVLAALLNEEVFWPGIPRGDFAAKRLPSNVAAVLERITRQDREAGIESPRPGMFSLPTLPSPHLAELHTLLPDLRTELKVPSPQLAELHAILAELCIELKVPLPTATPSEVRWISTECCGLFFLTSTLTRLGWISAWIQLPDFQPGGVACLIAGLALAMVGKFDAGVATLDPGIALFAGYLGEPDIAHLRKVFQEFPSEVQLRVLRAAIKDKADHAEDWQSTFDCLATHLLRDFASHIRGFRQASRQAIVRSFIAQRGRIRIEREKVVVFPNASPFHVALHIAGMDTPLESVSWLDGRRLEFELEDL